MNLLFDTVSLLTAVLLQICSGSFSASGFPFVLCAVLVISMRYNPASAVVTAFFAGLIVDFVFGREFAVNTVSFPFAAAVGGILLPEDPMRFFFGDYIVPGCASVFTAGLLHLITPLFWGAEWYYLVPQGEDVALSTGAAAGIVPLWILLSDRIAHKLEVRRIFSRTMKFALRPARR